MHRYIIASLVPLVGLAWAAESPHDPPGRPALPEEPYEYADRHFDLPAHFVDGRGPLGGARRADNTPPDNPITDEGATLGRVLFYDTRLSVDNTVSCGGCHQQQHGFSAPDRLSPGINGQATERHSMSLANARYYRSGRFFWDERAATLEDQVLIPIQSTIEMGMTLPELERKLEAEDFYPSLFEAAFGTPDVTSERISKALAQFVRSLVSYQSRFDRALEAAETADPAPRATRDDSRRQRGRRGRRGSPALDFGDALTEQEARGFRLFSAFTRNRGAGAGCGICHGTVVQTTNQVRNNGLDAETTDEGAGDGRFKAPSLRNIAVRAPYMHDGRFATLREVIEFYNSDVQPHPDLDRFMSGRTGGPRRLGLSESDIDALLAFLDTLTDEAFLTDPRFSDPFGGETP